MLIPREPGLGVGLGQGILQRRASDSTPVSPDRNARPLANDGSMAIAV